MSTKAYQEIPADWRSGFDDLLRPRIWIPIAVALAAYASLVLFLRLVQDDAYITLRYAANFLNGNGLVYNAGERIASYGSFGWLLLVVLLGRVGLDQIVWYQMAGFFAGAMFIVLSTLTARRVFYTRTNLATVGVAFLLACNLSLAYWSSSSLETAAFAGCAALVLHAYIIRSPWLMAGLVWAALLRPEGWLWAGIVLVMDAIRTRGRPRFALSCVATAALFLAPYLVFKWTYYGTLLPGALYAGSGFAFSQWSDGLKYAGRFLADYGFYGAGLLIPFAAYRTLSADLRAVLWYTLLYSGCVVFIGDDVNEAYRDFVPVFGSWALLTVFSVLYVARRLTRQASRAVVAAVLAALFALTLYLPGDRVSAHRRRARDVTRMMSFRAEQLKATDPTAFSVALPTSGIFGYRLLGHRIIDMLGLTDATIAWHSEPAVPGTESAWREGMADARYLLEEQPNYIIFSTGTTPTLPVERALLLYPQFLRAYRPLGWYYQPGDAPQGVILDLFKRMRSMTGEIRAAYPAEYVDEYVLGLESRDPRVAIRHYNRALSVQPPPPNLNLVYDAAVAHRLVGNDSVATQYLNGIIQQDSMMYPAHRDLYYQAMVAGDRARARIHRGWILELMPWYSARLDSLVARQTGRSF